MASFHYVTRTRDEIREKLGTVPVLANETYRQYYDLRNVNVAAAYASFILLLSMITAIFYLRAVRTQEEVIE